MSDIDIQTVSHTDKEGVDKYQSKVLNEIKGISEDALEEESITDDDFVDETMNIKITRQEDEDSDDYSYDDNMEIDG